MGQVTALLNSIGWTLPVLPELDDLTVGMLSYNNKNRCLSDFSKCSGCTDDLHTSLLSDVDAASPNSDMWAKSGLQFDMPVLED